MSRKRWSLKQRLLLLNAIVMVPLGVLAIYLIVVMKDFTGAYNQIVKNVTAINNYNLNFKEEMDYAMYRVVIGSVSFDELKKGDKIDDIYSSVVKNPYLMIEEAREDFKNLELVITNPNSAGKIQGILTSLDSLEHAINKLEENLKYQYGQEKYEGQENGNFRSVYTENMNLLENDVRSTTTMIQEFVQQYIYYETQSFETIRIDLERQVGQAVMLSAILLAASLLAGGLVSGKIVDSVTGPIKGLCMAAEEMGEGDFDSRIEVESGNEIQILAKGFDQMRGKIKTLIQDVKIEQSNLRATELKLLQVQINPHFLYNTLDAIVWMAEGGQNKEVISMTTSLSDFFRTALSGGRDFITVAEEEKHVHSYLRIQRYRYQDILEYKIHIDQELYPCRVLKMTLQPIVENALYHGIKNKRGKGMIQIRGYEKDGKVIFEVEDNGIGMTEEKLKNLRWKIRNYTGEGEEGRGFGLVNVEERLKLNYGKEYGLHIDSKEGKGTIVYICVPKDIAPTS